MFRAIRRRRHFEKSKATGTVLCITQRTVPVAKDASFNDIRSVPERVIYASHMISPSGMIYACGE